MELIYKEKNITLINGDCLDIIDKIIATNLKHKFDLLLTDPPYNIAQKNNFTSMGRKGLDFGDWDKGFDQEAWLHKIDDLISPNGSVVIFNTFQNLALTQKILEGYGFVYKDFIIMKKNNPMPRNRERRYINSCEYALWMTRKDAKWIFNMQNSKYDSNVIDCNVVAGKEKTAHTTQKPISVIKDLILRHSNENSIIIDPFCGSGTTMIASKELGRKCVCIELDKN